MPGCGSCWADLQQRFGNLSTGGSLDGQFLSEAITANGIFLLCLVSSPNKYLENDQNQLAQKSDKEHNLKLVTLK